MATAEQVSAPTSNREPVVSPGRATIDANQNGRPIAVRHRLPDERNSITHRFNVGGHKGYLIVGLYPDGAPGELFITIAKEGSSVSGLMSSVAQVVSVALQHGVPLEVLCEKLTHMRFEPSGFTGNAEIPFAKSIMDYIFQWLRLRFSGESTGRQPLLPPAPHFQMPAQPIVAGSQPSFEGDPQSQPQFSNSLDAPFCVHCGTLTVRSGACFICTNCGNSSGCG